MKRPLGALLLVFMLAASSVVAQDDQETGEQKKYRGGALRLGAFWVFQIDMTVAVKSQKFPLGVHIDVTRDLGLTDSVTVPRLLFTYRFNRRSQIDFDWFRIERESLKRLERTIDFGRWEFPIGVEAKAFTDISIYKTVYTWLFHDDPKVTLGLSAGLHIVDFKAGLDAGRIREGDNDRSERAGITAPLPVIGGRLVYRVSPKIGVLFTADVLMVRYDDYSGTFQDVYAMAEYRLSRRFGVGGGLNVLSLDVKVDGDKRLGRLQNTLTGVLAYAAVYF